jgi:hypothetical protein
MNKKYIIKKNKKWEKASDKTLINF